MDKVFLVSLLIFAVAAIPPEANQPFPELVGNLSYPYETHLITTQDGYINTYFRIQAKNTQIRSGLPVVYVQHGVADSSDNWVVNNESLAPGFILANNGFDVWLGNTRGNRYSQGHVGVNGSDPNSTYWDFSWQEMSLYDIPAAFEYISNQTGQVVNYIGHSQGTTIMFAALSRRDPTVLKYLGKFLAAGPVAYVSHSTSKLIRVTADTNIGKWFYKKNFKKILFTTPLELEAMELTCQDADIVCKTVLKDIGDFNTTVDNTKRMDIFVGHYPAGASVQTMYYWNQLFDSDEFVMFNYGEQGNLQHYNQTTPPFYNLSQVNVPVYLFAGYYDELADPTDVEILKSQLTGSPLVELNTYPYGHASFFWALNTYWIYDAINTINASDNLDILV